MGYNTTYKSSITFSEHTAESVINRFIDFLDNTAGCDDHTKCTPIYGNGTLLRFSGCQYYHRESWDDALKAVQSYITEGCITFDGGEDDLIWKTKCAAGSEEWVECIEFIKERDPSWYSLDINL